MITGRSLAPWVLALVVAGSACTEPGSTPAADRPPDDQLWVQPERFDGGTARIATTQEADIPQAVVASGRLAFDDMKVSHVLSPVSGRVTRILARLGDEVKQGTPLIALASPDVGSAVADEVKARADLSACQRERDRQRRLAADGAASSRDAEAAEDNYLKAKAEEDRALQRLRLFKTGKIDAVTQEIQLPSPIDGRVIARSVNPGLQIQGQYSGGTAVELFTVGRIDDLWLYADIPEDDLPLVRVDEEVSAVVLAYPEHPFHGRVEWISPSLDPQLRTFRIRCSLPNPEGLLKPEMVAQVTIHRPSQRMLSIPRQAVVRINDHAFAYVAMGDRPNGQKIFQRRQIRVPERSGPVTSQTPRAGSEVFQPAPSPAEEVVPVLEGLAPGERVLADEFTTHDTGDAEVALTPEQIRHGAISVEKVDERELPDLVAIGARIAFDDLRVSHVFSPVGGRISRVIATPGQHVKRGDPLAVIQSPEVGSAFSDVIKAKADLDAAEHELRRQASLNQVQAGARRDLEAAQDARDRAKAELVRAEDRTRILREGALSQITQEFVLKSPIEGEVTARNANPGLEVQGQYSGASNVVELFTIGQTDPLWLMGDLYEMDLPFAQVGDEVAFHPSTGGPPISGQVDWISDVLDPQMHTAKLRVVLSNADHRLRPEMYGMATLSVAHRKSISVPRESVLRLGERTVVFVAGGSGPGGVETFREREVVVDDQRAGDRVPILSGLKPGEQVAATGAIFLLGIL